MSPAEGFLLSRIDGRTPWSLLRAIGGAPADEVDRILERWVGEGLLVLDGADDPPTGSQAPEAERTLEDQVDASLELSLELQRAILEFEAGLSERSYFEILGVGGEADARAIKRAYFALSKKFHPDRYFRREIGPYAARLERIFKRVMEAYELLSDPTTRAEIEKGFGGAPPPAPAKPAPAQTSEAQPPGGYTAPSRLDNLRRLRNRFRVPPELLAERQLRAGQFFQAAQLSMQQQSWLEAAASARLAIAFDPWNAEFKSGFVEIQAHVNRERAMLLLEQAAGADAQGEAMRLLEEAIHFRPSDAVANARAASLALSMGDLERAREYADAAAEFDPDEAAYHVLRCRVLRREGELKAARSAIDLAVELAPGDAEVVAERRLLLRGEDA